MTVKDQLEHLKWLVSLWNGMYIIIVCVTHTHTHTERERERDFNTLLVLTGFHYYFR